MTDFKTSDRDINRAIRSWLHEDRHEDVSRVAGTVLTQVEATPQRRSTWWTAWRTPPMNKIVGFGLAAAALVAAVLIGSQFIGAPTTNVGGPGAEPTPTPTADPTPDPTPEPTPQGLLPEGPHVILDGEAPDPGQETTPPLTVTIPAPGWYGETGGGILIKNDNHEPPDGTGMIVFAQREYYVYGDPCHWTTTTPDTPVTTVDAFVAALATQASRDASEPVDITLDGYAGKSITLSVPDDADFSGCDRQASGSWSCDVETMVPCEYHSGPGEIDTVYILDIDGVIVAWQTKYYAGTPAEDVAELEAIVQSASFGE